MNTTIKIRGVSWKLSRGAHSLGDRQTKACLLEVVSLKAEEPFSDRPESVSPVLAAFGRGLWDTTPDDQPLADLLPFADRLIGTAGRPDLDQEAGLMAADWAIRRFPAPWLRLAGLDSHADALAALPPLTTWDLVETASKTARVAADAARDAARAAARAAARDAARAATWVAARGAARAATRDAGAAARDAARDAARAAAWAAADAAWDAAQDAAADAARAATRDAAWAATWAALAPTSAALRAEAINSFNRMIALWEA